MLQILSNSTYQVGYCNIVLIQPCLLFSIPIHLHIRCLEGSEYATVLDRMRYKSVNLNQISEIYLIRES